MFTPHTHHPVRPFKRCRGALHPVARELSIDSHLQRTRTECRPISFLVDRMLPIAIRFSAQLREADQITGSVNYTVITATQVN